MGGHYAVSLVVAIVLGLHSVAADCRVVGIVSDAPRISGNVSVADAPGILLEGHSQGVLTSGHKSAKRIHLHALAEGVDTTKLLGHDNTTRMRGEGLAPSTTGRGQAHIVTAHGDTAYGGGFVPIPRGVPVLIGAGSSSGSPANGTEWSSEQRCAVITGVTYECDTADVETLPGDAAVLIIGALVATYSHRMIGVTILWGALAGRMQRCIMTFPPGAAFLLVPVFALMAACVGIVRVRAGYLLGGGAARRVRGVRWLYPPWRPLQPLRSRCTFGCCATRTHGRAYCCISGCPAHPTSVSPLAFVGWG